MLKYSHLCDSSVKISERLYGDSANHMWKVPRQEQSHAITSYSDNFPAAAAGFYSIYLSLT